MANSAPERTAVACPHCGKRLQVPVALLGKTGKCPGCQANFTIVAAATAINQLVVPPEEATPFTPGPAPVYPNQERIAPVVIEPSLPKYLLAQIMAVLFALFFVVAMIAVSQFTRAEARHPGSGKFFAMGIAFFGVGGLVTAYMGSWLIYAGVKAMLTRRIPLSRTSQLRGIPAQIGAVFFIVCGLAFTVGIGVCIFVLMREGLK